MPDRRHSSSNWVQEQPGQVGSFSRLSILRGQNGPSPTNSSAAGSPVGSGSFVGSSTGSPGGIFASSFGGFTPIDQTQSKESASNPHKKLTQAQVVTLAAATHKSIKRRSMSTLSNPFTESDTHSMKSTHSGFDEPQLDDDQLEIVNYNQMEDDELVPFLDRPKEVSDLLQAEVNKELWSQMAVAFSYTSPADDVFMSSVKNSLCEQLQSDAPTLLPQDYIFPDLAFLLTQVAREQMPDYDWLMTAQAAVTAKSEALWMKLSACLGMQLGLLDQIQSQREAQDAIDSQATPSAAVSPTYPNLATELEVVEKNQPETALDVLERKLSHAELEQAFIYTEEDDLVFNSNEVDDDDALDDGAVMRAAAELAMTTSMGSLRSVSGSPFNRSMNDIREADEEPEERMAEDCDESSSVHKSDNGESPRFRSKGLHSLSRIETSLESPKHRALCLLTSPLVSASSQFDSPTPAAPVSTPQSGLSFPSSFAALHQAVRPSTVTLADDRQGSTAVLNAAPTGALPGAAGSGSFASVKAEHRKMMAEGKAGATFEESSDSGGEGD